MAKVRVRCRAYVFLCADSPVVIGPWDGLAGFIKRTLRRRIIDGGLVLQGERDVFREIQKLCGEIKCEGKVDHWNVDWLESSNITHHLQLQAAWGRAATAAGLMQLPTAENRRIEAIVAH